MESTKSESENFTADGSRQSRGRRFLKFYQDSFLAGLVPIVLIVVAFVGVLWLIVAPSRDAENKWAKAWQSGEVQITNTSISYSEMGITSSVVSAPLTPGIAEMNGYQIYGVYLNSPPDDQLLPRTSSVKTNTCVNFYPENNYTFIRRIITLRFILQTPLRH